MFLCFTNTTHVNQVDSTGLIRTTEGPKGGATTDWRSGWEGLSVGVIRPGSGCPVRLCSHVIVLFVTLSDI